MPPILPYGKLVAPHATTRSSDGATCSCSVCQIAGMFPVQAQRALLSTIFCGGAAEHPEVKAPSPNVILQCSKCLTYIGKGKSHKCKKRTKQDNLAGMVKSSSKKTKGKVTSSCLKAVFDEAGVTTRGGSTTIPTGSRPITVRVGTRRKGVMKTGRFSTENLIRLQTAFNLSDKTTL